MAMEFGNASKKIGDVVTNSLVEGGGITVGLLGSGFIGKQSENMFKKGVLPTSSATDKILSYVANNGAKVGLYMVINKVAPSKTSGFLGEMLFEAKKGAVASIVLDTVVRAGNNFAPKTLFTINGWDVLSGEKVGNTVNQTQLQQNFQRVLQENGSLRTQLNQALGKMASAPSQPQIDQPQINSARYPDHDREYGLMTEEAVRRRKDFSSMESEAPMIAERNRKFGQMSMSKLNGDIENVGASYGML